jgi:hypothetical protein
MELADADATVERKAAMQVKTFILKVVMGSEW